MNGAKKFKTRCAVLTAYNDLVVKEILGINWQRNITNKDLNDKTKCEPWSQVKRKSKRTNLARTSNETKF